MQGTFIWYELMAADPVAAAAFYGKVAGWQVRAEQTAQLDYSVFYLPGFEMGQAGMMALTSEMTCSGARPGWIAYIAVSDVDAKAEEAVSRDGVVLKPAADIPGIGRFAVMADPHGAAFCLFKPNMPEGPLPACPEPGSPGTFGWRELYAGNGDEAFAFYAGLFGWEKGMAVDMGEMGVYQCFDLAGQAIGGMMTATPDMGPPTWNYYINVDAIDAGVERVREAGGTILIGPHQVPGDSWIANALDPEGALFSLMSARR